MAQPAVREEMGVFEAMRRRRMHRAFLPDPVDEELLERLVYAAGRAPVVREGLRHVVVVTDPRLMATVRQVCPGWINDAPALIAICSDTRRTAEVLGEGSGYVSELDSGAAAAYLSLAAPALGLGICLVTSWTKPVAQAVLGLPEHVEPFALVAVGRPVPNPPKAPRRFEPIVHRDRYGTP